MLPWITTPVITLSGITQGLLERKSSTRKEKGSEGDRNPDEVKDEEDKSYKKSGGVMGTEIEGEAIRDDGKNASSIVIVGFAAEEDGRVLSELKEVDGLSRVLVCEPT
ncbi:MAG: hypothetical protein M1827_003202 [Pycnora praestabilis]|nr:MAG: hypothetical protein M1827_003202 [Pycnora praestabilis]